MHRKSSQGAGLDLPGKEALPHGLTGCHDDPTQSQDLEPETLGLGSVPHSITILQVTLG